MIVGDFHHKGMRFEVYNIKNRYTVFTDGRLVQRDLTPDAFVAWACNALEDGTEGKEKVE